MRSFFTAICIVITLGACRASDQGTDSDVKSILTRGADGETFVIFQHQYKPQLIVGRRCPETAIIHNFDEIDSVCKPSIIDRHWNIEEFKTKFTDAFFTPDMRAVAQASPYGKILDYERDFAEASIKARDDYIEKLEAFKALLIKAQKHKAQVNAERYKQQIEKYEGKLNQIENLSSLMLSFQSDLEAFVDYALRRAEVYLVFSGSGPHHHLLTELIGKLIKGPFYFCRGCKSIRNTFRCGNNTSMEPATARKEAIAMCNDLGNRLLPVEQQTCFSLTYDHRDDFVKTWRQCTNRR